MKNESYNINIPSYPILENSVDFSWSSGTYSFPSTLDGSMVVHRYRNFSLTGGTITTANRCQ